MPRNVRCGLIQTKCEWSPAKLSIDDIKRNMVRKHERLIGEAAKKGVQILCLQELFYGPYFAAEPDARWYKITEPIPDGPSIAWARQFAKKYKMAMVVRIAKSIIAVVPPKAAAIAPSQSRPRWWCRQTACQDGCGRRCRPASYRRTLAERIERADSWGKSRAMAAIGLSAIPISET